MDKTAEKAIYLAQTIHEVYTGKCGEDQIPVTMITYSQPLIDSIGSTNQVTEKLTRPIVRWLQQMGDKGAITDIIWCDMHSCLPYIMTKPGSGLTNKVLNTYSSGHMIDLCKCQNNQNICSGGLKLYFWEFIRCSSRQIHPTGRIPPKKLS